MSVPRAVLVIGGTRNLGHELVHALRAAGSRVTVLNRGRTPDELPRDVERLRADRSDRAALGQALAGDAADLLPACSPFSDRWMSELDKANSRTALGVRYTPVAETLARLIAWYRDHPEIVAPGYRQRPRELAFAREMSS